MIGAAIHIMTGACLRNTTEFREFITYMRSMTKHLNHRYIPSRLMNCCQEFNTYIGQIFLIEINLFKTPVSRLRVTVGNVLNTPNSTTRQFTTTNTLTHKTTMGTLHLGVMAGNCWMSGLLAIGDRGGILAGGNLRYTLQCYNHSASTSPS
ncbi:hypothetical protein L211DRAFT_105235 [Terfezia boudieri ATCC MYA-4762]|uniref:Uncharacterized protein n=1 Tax=Terfezia boudieri ATCC MYA-4762 TaxID=1051890 RepID=A0A3N4LQW5_9PEZI|nr:hypothetical protein L211DRAFT_105235 [Terfezia boudieri ATCC MYA-4762]